MVRAGGNLPRGTDGLKGIVNGVSVGSARTMDVVDVPGSDIGGDSSSGDEVPKGEIIGIVGRDFNLIFVESIFMETEVSAASCPMLDPLGGLLAFVEEEPSF